MVAKVLEILGAEATESVHNHHNFAWKERHFDTDVWVVRKGCTPAFPGQEGFVGATMGEPSVILRGSDSDASRELLYSTVHGAGRVMSRTQAAGKMRTRAECSVRDCDFWVSWKQRQEAQCPDHPGRELLKRRRIVKPGLIDFAAVQSELAGAGIELRGGAADEAPGAYKRLDAVLAAHGDTIEIVHRLTPLGVAMAGADTSTPTRTDRAARHEGLARTSSPSSPYSPAPHPCTPTPRGGVVSLHARTTWTSPPERLEARRQVPVDGEHGARQAHPRGDRRQLVRGVRRAGEGRAGPLLDRA